VAQLIVIGSSSGGGSSEDRFAPRYVVGNVLAGQSAVPLDVGGFTYIPDPGNGSGIAAALIAAGMVPGDVAIRPGTYDLDSIGSPVAIMVVPAGVRVNGAGQGVTVILGRTAGDQGIFRLSDDSSISDMKLDVQTVGGEVIYSGSSSVVQMFGARCMVERCVFDLATTLSSFIVTCIEAGGGVVRDCEATGTPRGGPDDPIWTSFIQRLDDLNQLTVQNCRVLGFDVSLISRCTSSSSRTIVNNLYSESPALFGVYQSIGDGACEYISITDSEFFCEAGVVGVSFGSPSFFQNAGGSLINSKIVGDGDQTSVPAVAIRAGGGGLIRVQGNMILGWNRPAGAAIDIGLGAPSDPCNGNLIQNNQIFNQFGTGVEVLNSSNSDNMVQNNLIIAAVPVVSASATTQISGNTP